ncbi:DUF2000 family protein [Cellulomonas sp. Marseille-Q8402]
MLDDLTAPAVTPDPARFDTKVAVLLRDDLLPWQELNVTAFLVSGIMTTAADLAGDPYRDQDGTAYLPMLRQPVVVLTGSAETLAAARARALSRGVPIAVYTRDLFETGHDAANRAAVAAVPGDALDLVGIGLRAPRNAADRITKGARMHA